MAGMANITVKKSDGTTDVIYVAATPSAGDKSPAVWTQDAFSGIQGFRPRLELLTQDNGSGTVRQVRCKYVYPSLYTDSTTGLSKQLANVLFDGTFNMPKQMTTTEWKEAWAQLGNLLCSSLVRGSVETGFAPT
uniref:Uncharacterized protein n=1 Tax=Leviviridae sp. TaxID=2027243 RepID=A0A514D6Q4_9VIRU|nr:MAG: hypothetical protein H2Rhizo32917_000002 [Leviviridae sp.]